jgi:hypothetical protein
LIFFIYLLIKCNGRVNCRGHVWILIHLHWASIELNWHRHGYISQVNSSSLSHRKTLLHHYYRSTQHTQIGVVLTSVQEKRIVSLAISEVVNTRLPHRRSSAKFQI